MSRFTKIFGWIITIVFSIAGIMVTGLKGDAQQVKKPGLIFPRSFSPQEGLIKPVEKPYRDEICLNGSWQFQPMPLPAGYDASEYPTELTHR